MLDQLVPFQCTDGAPAQDFWLRVILTGLAALSMYLTTKTLVHFQTQVSLGHPAAESPTMFLLAWLAGSDTLVAMSSLLLLWCAGPDGIANTHVANIQRVIVSAQICYFLQLILLSIHVLSIVGKVDRKLDMVASDYYGPVSGTLAFLLGHPLVSGLRMHHRLVLTVLPMFALVALAAAAWQAFAAHSTISSSLQMRVDDSVTIRVKINPSDYVRFSCFALGTFVAFHVPWFVWGHAQTQTPLLTWLAAAALCARGMLPFILFQTSPATNMVLQNSAQHQE